jgi:hypothetical protein
MFVLSVNVNVSLLVLGVTCNMCIVSMDYVVCDMSCVC